MNTKMIKYSLIVAVSLVFTTSCKQYLEVESPSSFDADYVFSNENDARKMILSAYALFGEDSYTSRQAFVWMMNTDTELAVPGNSPDGSRRDIWSLQGGRLAGFGDVYTAWNHNYLAIDRTNQCIEGILKSDIKENRMMKHMLGEMYCMRAYRYFLLTNFWGDVPYFRESAKGGMELDRPKTDKNYIYSGNIQDLIDSEEGMLFADQTPDGIERMNREFAMGMIARLALFRAGYAMTKSGQMKRADDYLNLQNDSLAVTYTYNGTKKTARTSKEYYQLARDYCQKLIDLKDRPLNPDFAKVFENQNLLIKPVNDDMLYEVAYVAGFGGDVGWAIGVSVNPAGSKGSTTIQFSLSAPYYFSFDDKDLRRDPTVALVAYSGDNEVPRSIKSFDVNKWNRTLLANPGPASSKGTGINWPLMRYSDVLLMLAEADNELNGGPTAHAKNMLKRVRQRAFKPEDHTVKVDNYINGLGSKDAFFNAIVDERAWEFGGEALRKFDLVRWNIYGKKILETKEKLTNMAKAARGVELDNPAVAQYSNLADYTYWYKTGGKVKFLTTKYKLADDKIPSADKLVVAADIDLPGNEGKFVRVGWARDFGDYVNGTWVTDSYVNNCWRGFKGTSNAAAVPYLIAIHSQITGASKYLNNEGYGLVNE